MDDETTSKRDLTSNAVSGTDKRGESERRYGSLERESQYRPRHGDREREYQEKNKGLSPEAENKRYRRDEKHQSGG